MVILGRYYPAKDATFGLWDYVKRMPYSNYILAFPWWNIILYPVNLYRHSVCFFHKFILEKNYRLYTDI